MNKSKKNNFSNKISIWAALLFLGLFSVGILYKMSDMGYLNLSGRGLPVYGESPDFKLIDRGGGEISKKDLLGQVWVADFIFTRCAGQCPIMTLAMSKLAIDKKDIKFVSITSDPGYDTPEVLSTYASWYEADEEQWFFLTGAKQDIEAIALGFKLMSIEDPALHSNYFVLVDKEGRVRGYYDPNDAEKLKSLKQDIDILRRK